MSLDNTDFIEIASDRWSHIPFLCKIGQVQARLGVCVEPDPHGDGKGTHAHFHTVITCPKTKIVDWPEPDRCSVIDRTCPFWEPAGGYKRDETQRKWQYAHQLIHYSGYLEVYGIQLLSEALRFRGFEISGELPDLRFQEIIDFLSTLKLVDHELSSSLTKIRKVRNTLAHQPAAYQEFAEKELYELVLLAEDIADKLRNEVSNFKK